MVTGHGTIKKRPDNCPHAKALDDLLKDRPIIKTKVEAACKRAKTVSEQKKKEQEEIEAAAKAEAERNEEEYDGKHPRNTLNAQQCGCSGGTRMVVSCLTNAYDEDGNASRISKVEAARRRGGMKSLMEDLAAKEKLLSKNHLEVLGEREGYRVTGPEQSLFRRYSGGLEEARAVARKELPIETGVKITEEECYQHRKSYAENVAALLNAEANKLGFKKWSVQGGTNSLYESLSSADIGYCWHANGEFICRDKCLENILEISDDDKHARRVGFNQKRKDWKTYQVSKKCKQDNEASAASGELVSSITLEKLIFQDDEDEYAEMIHNST